MPELSIEPKPVGYLRAQQITELREDRKHFEKQLQDPHIEEKAEVAKMIRRIDHQLATQTPPILSPEGRDAAEKERVELETFIQDGMLSHEEMRKNPNGAVGRHQKHTDRTLQAQLRWKDVMKMLHPGDTDEDLCNVERLRPTASTMGMHDTQIPGRDYHFAPNNDEYRRKWDETFGGATPEEILSKQNALEARLEALENASKPKRSKAPRKKSPRRQVREERGGLGLADNAAEG
jgi:hypothetical protein